MRRRQSQPAVLWAAAGIGAGALAWLSPWLAVTASLGCLGAAVWRDRQRPAPPQRPASGDLSTAWPAAELDPLRQDLLGLWQRVQQSSASLQRVLERLAAQQDECERLLQHGSTDLQTVSRSVLAQKTGIGKAVEAISAAVWQWQHVQQQWAAATGALSELQAWSGQQTAIVQAVQGRQTELLAVWQEVAEAGKNAVHLIPADPGVAPSTQWESLATGAQQIADEAGRLGKTGWPMALAATTWAEEARAMLADLQRPRWDHQPLVMAGERLMGALAACEQAMALVQTASSRLDARSPESKPMAPLPQPDLATAAARLDAIDREAELAAGLAEEQVSQLSGLQQRLQPMGAGLEKARHSASELLILSGYVRTAPSMPACHLNRTVWCITDGVCERCPLTRLSEADFPGLLGANARQAPAVAKTGRTIDLDPEHGH